MRLPWILIVLCLLAGACSRQPEATLTSANANADAELDTGPVVQRKPQDAIDWSPVQLEAGDAWVDCSADYTQGGGRPLLSLAYEDLRRSVQDCRGTGLLRLRYKGKVTASFAALMERTGRVAGDLGIGKRILDIDSAGGHVEAAIRAGDAIGENDWTIWVRGDSVCHSACVLLLAAGDMRVIAGPVGIHRMIRLRSSATSRKELGEELRTVSDELRNYLERNGASDKVYDLMTTVPNRTLRILTVDELDQVGLADRADEWPSRLSGGQRQRVALARALIHRPRLLLLDEPTRGIDIGAKEEIYQLMEQLASQGVAILFVSSEMEELLGMSDRVLVMHEGRMAGELSRSELSGESVMQLATGGSPGHSDNPLTCN